MDDLGKPIRNTELETPYGSGQPVRQDPILLEMIRRLVDACSPQRIYLFGSRARREAGAESDYDFLVVIAHTSFPRYERDRRAYRALCGAGAAKDVVVLTSDEFERSLGVASSLPATVVREGVLVYGA